MLLVVDVGNTHITLGVFDGKELKATFRMTAKQPRTAKARKKPGITVGSASRTPPV